MVSTIADAVSETRNGAIITVEVSAGGKRNAFPSEFNPWKTTIGCRVTAPAINGRANKAVVALIAESLNIPVSSVKIQSGTTSPVKRIIIEGMKKPDLLVRLKALI